MTRGSHFSEDIEPDQLAIYLHHRQWVLASDLRNVAGIWRKDGFEGEVVAPLRKDLKDYQRRVVDAISVLAEEEGRLSSMVARDVAELRSNTVSVRVIHQDTKKGTIPLDDGLDLIKAAKDLFTSSALSMQSRRRHFSGHVAKSVSEFAETLLLGQTEVGSYVVTVIAPAKFSQQSSIDVPYASAVAENLCVGLSALRVAEASYALSTNIGFFDGAVEKGVSANLCDALVAMSGSNQDREFEIRISQAAAYAPQRRDEVFAFSPNSVRRISEAWEYLKDNFVIRDQGITGYVKRLDRVHGAEFGTVTVSAEIGGTERQVSIELPAAQYDQSILAHLTEKVVECRGDIHITPKSAKLLNASGFAVLASGELFE
mgnify:FL=1